MRKLKKRLETSPRGNLASNSTMLTEKLPSPRVNIQMNTFFSPRTLGMTKYIGHDSVSHRRKISLEFPNVADGTSHVRQKPNLTSQLWNSRRRSEQVVRITKRPYHTQLKQELMNSPQAASCYYGPARTVKQRLMQQSQDRNPSESAQAKTSSDFFKTKSKSVTAPKQRPAKSELKGLKTTNGARRGVLLLSNYRPNEFGNANIDLTVDGGQHHRSPGDSPPKITHKHVEQIFKDPVFDHKPQLRKLESRNRRKVISDIQSSIERIETRLNEPKNYRQFFWAKNMEVFGFGTPSQIKATREHLQYIDNQQKYY